MTIYLPAHVAEQKRREFAAEIAKRIHMDQRCEDFTDRLQREIDPNLVMVKAHDLIAPGTPLKPGFYHVLRRNDGAPMTVIPITEHGRYVEPDSRLFTKLAAGNMTQRRVRDQIDRQDRAAEEAAHRDEERAKQDRRTELVERTKAVTRAQISLNRSVPWTQNSSPTSRRDAAGRRSTKR
jgi:hypothetical protein